MTKEFQTSITRRKDKSYKATLPFEFEEASVSDVVIPQKIHLIPIGQWEHDTYGPIIINASDIREYQQNFNAGIRKGVFITAGHEGFEELPACGWIKEVESRDNGLWGIVDWTELGKETLSDKQYKFFSPEMYRDYEDPETHQLYRNVLTGGALTKSPYFKELESVVFSEPKKIINKFDEKKSMTKTLAEVLAIEDVSTLTDEEKAVLKEGEATLTEEQKTKFAPALEVKAPEKTPEELEKETGDANEAAGLNRDGSTKEPKIEGSEKITMSKLEFSLLKEKADKGAEAFKELEKNKLDAAVGALIFSSETNKEGKFLPKSKDSLHAFMETLNTAQRTAFSSLLKDLPKSQLFEEKGDGTGGDAGGTDAEEVEKKTAEKITTAEKAGKKLSYSEALKQVMSENPELGKRYESGAGLKSVGKGAKEE